VFKYFGCEIKITINRELGKKPGFFKRAAFYSGHVSVVSIKRYCYECFIK
jgi:hypothetical protein